MRLHEKYLALLEHASRAGHGDVDDLRLCFELLSLTAAIDQDCAAHLSPHGLSEGKFVVLFLLSDASEGLSPHQLADHAGVTRATITGLLSGLERDGLVTRRGAEGDGRRVNVQLTRKGRKTAHDLTRQHTAWIASLFSHIQADDRRMLRRAIHAVWSNTDAGTRSPADGPVATTP